MTATPAKPAEEVFLAPCSALSWFKWEGGTALEHANSTPVAVLWRAPSTSIRMLVWIELVVTLVISYRFPGTIEPDFKY